MATEAEIIQEPISLVKTEEESKDLTLEQCDKAVGDLKKLQGGIIQPTETDECLEKAKSMEVSSNNGVETMNTASEGNPEISKGESFLVSPEISKAANETCRMSEHSEVCEGPKSIIKEECAIIDNSPKSTAEENAAAMMSIKEKIEDGSKAENKFEVSTSATNKKDSLEKEVEEREPEKEVCKESGTAVSGAGKGNPDMEEHPMAGISNSSISDVTMKESIKEDESSAMKSTEEASDSNIEETAKPNNDPSLLDVVKESEEEIAPLEVKKDLACSSLVELEESKNDTEEETSVKGRTNTGDLEAEAEAEETNIKEAEAEEEKKEVNNVHAVEEKGLATTEHEGIGIDSVDIDVKPEDSSITCEKEKEISHGEDRMQAPYEHTETPVSQATDEILKQKEGNPTLDVPKAESEDTGEESGYEIKEHLAEEPSQPSVQTEQESGKCSSVSEVTNVSNGDESSDLGLETEKIEDRKPLDSTDLGETASTWKDGEKAIQEEENLAKNLAKPESLKEHTEIGKEEAELPTGAQDQIPEVVNVNDEAKNVELALAGFEEKLKYESETVAEAQSNEALPESSKSQADETSIDVHSQESEKQIKGDILQDEDYISREQNANEVTKAVILSEVVDKEVEKVDDSEDIKEHAIEEESSTNEIHPLSKGNETIDVEIVDKDEAKVIKRDPDTVCISKDQIDEAEKSLTSNADEPKKTESPVDGDHPFEDKGTEQDAETKQILTAEELETSSVYSTRRVETIVEDDISSHTSLQVEKPDKQLQTSVSALPSEDEEIRTAPPTEKIEQEIQKDAEIKHESLEDSSDTKATEDVSLQEEEQRVPKAVSEEETIAYQGLRKEETEEQIQTTSSTLTSFEGREHETEATTTKPDEITGEQTLSANKPEEGTTSTALLSKEPEGESISRVEKTQEEKIKEAEIPDKISEDSSDAKKTAEICLERELEGANKDETAAQALQVGEPNEQSLTSPSELPTENTVHGTTANVNEVEEEKAKEVEILEKQRPQEPDSVVDQEITVAQASITEKSVEIETISTVEKPQEEKRKEAGNQENEKCEDSPARETEEICLQKEEPNELHALPKEEITSAVTGEELEHESKKTEDAKTNKEETVEDEIREDASDARTTEETCSQKERSIELEAVVEEQVQNPTSALPSKEEECESTSTVPVSFQVQEDEALAKDENDSSQTLQMEKSEEQILEPLVTLPSDEHKHETFSKVDKTEEEKVKEEEIQNEDSNGAKTVEGIGSEKDDTRGPQAVLEDETISSHVIEEEQQGHGTLREEKEIKEAETHEDEKRSQSEYPRELQGAIEIEATAAQTQPTKEGNGIILNEVSKEEVMEDKEVTETSYSTPHSKELTKGGSGEDELKDKVIEDKTNEALETKCQTEELVVEAQKTSEYEIIEKQIIFEDRTVENPGQASVARIETATATEEGSSTELSQAEGKEKINDSQQPEDTTNMASDRKIPRESDPIENTEISSPIFKNIAAESSQKAEVESSTKGTFQPEEQSPAPSSKLSSEEENGVETKADSVVEKELKEVGIEKDSSDTKTGEEICLAKEENRELKAVQIPTTEIKDPVSHFNDGCKEDELKDEDTGVLFVETLKDGANNDIEKEIVAEDKTVKDLEQASVGMKEATIVSEEVPAKADPIESTTSSISKEHFPTEQQERDLEASEKPEVGDLEPGKAQQISSEAGTDHGEEKRTDNSGVETTQESASADLGKLSLSDLLQRSTGEKMQVVEHVIEEGQTESKEEQHVVEAETIQVKEVKTEEEKDGEEGDEHNKTDSGPDAPVMVEAPRDTDTKPHKKSHNILSGVGSRVKHSISKVKKAITGKSSHSKESKPISPKESEK